MDFRLSEEQTSIRELAREIVSGELDADRLRDVERSEDGTDHALWGRLAEANLLGVVVPEAHGGMGFGVEELCVLLQELGRGLAPVPLHATATAALALARAGTKAQQAAWLPGVAEGSVMLSVALEDAGSGDVAAPAARAARDGDGDGDGDEWVLTGDLRSVPALHLARRVLVPAATEEGVGIFLVDPGGAGAERTSRRASTGEPLCDLALREARVPHGELLGEDAKSGDGVVRWLHEVALVGLCALQVGVSERALEITTGYVAQREQFGGPIGGFQAVQHRCADAYIDLESVRWTTWRAASRLARGVAVPREVAVAKFWAAEGGARIAATAQHLHGGIGVDVDYPIHRYFLWSKALELRLGGATRHLASLGRDLAARPPAEDA